MTKSSGEAVHLGIPEPGDSTGPAPQPGEGHCPLVHNLSELSEGLAHGGWGPRADEWPLPQDRWKSQVCSMQPWVLRPTPHLLSALQWLQGVWKTLDLEASPSPGSDCNFFPTCLGAAPSEPLTFESGLVSQASPCAQAQAPSLSKPPTPTSANLLSPLMS